MSSCSFYLTISYTISYFICIEFTNFTIRTTPPTNPTFPLEERFPFSTHKGYKAHLIKG